MEWFWLYRPPAPTVRAQSIQVVNMAHAMAARGHTVTLCVDPADGVTSPADVLAFYGLAPIAGLNLVVLPAQSTLASIAFRGSFAAFVARTGGNGVVYARSKRYAAEALRRLGGRFRLVLEQHEVDSVQAMDNGEDPGTLRLLEREVLAGAQGLVCNCEGTLELWREVHGALPPAIALHNATHPSRMRQPSASASGAGYVGSVRDYKDVDLLAQASRQCGVRITVVGASTTDAIPLQRLADGKLAIEPPLRHADVPDRLAKFRVLVIPLAPGLFGERLTSPLKLWDYLASGVPIVGADLGSMRNAAPGAYLPYVANDPASLARAIERVDADEGLRAQLTSVARTRVRTWADRAREVEEFVKGLP